MSEISGNYPFIYETHLHTSEASACAWGSGADMVEGYIACGYAGMIVTDHFFNGNCAVPAGLPWPDRVERFCAGYENALAAAAGRDFGVFFGWEYNCKGMEFLTYGLGKDFLLAHPDLHAWEIESYLKAVRAAGGLVSQAHPFRQRSYIKEIRLFPELVDAVEVFNAADQDEWNELAAEFAARHNLACTAGSDTHGAPGPEEVPRAGVAFARRLGNIADFVAAVKARELQIYRKPKSPGAEPAA